MRTADLTLRSGHWLGIALLATASLHAASATDSFFGDEVLVRGKGVEIRRPALDQAYLQFKANATLRDQTIPPDRVEELEAMLLDRLVITRLLMNRATEADRKHGQTQAEMFTANVIKEAGSETAFNRQLIALGFTREDFETQVRERAICEEVVERELHDDVTITDVDVRQYYEANRQKLQRPEMMQARHILLAVRDPQTGVELADAKKAEKRLLAENLLKRAKQGEDFSALVQEFSEDEGSKEKQGEYIFSRGQMAPAFEAAAFSLEPGKISDVVTTVYGYHIIKLIQRIPPEPIPLESIRDDLTKKLKQEEVQETLLPKHLKALKAEAGLQYFKGARPPTEAANQLP